MPKLQKLSFKMRNRKSNKYADFMIFGAEPKYNPTIHCMVM